MRAAGRLLDECDSARKRHDGLDVGNDTGCKRMRKTFLYRCSGVPPEPGESNSSPTTICDNCLANADCKDQPGGECQETGNGACTGPAHLVCKYPEARCGNKICPEPVTVMPP